MDADAHDGPNDARTLADPLHEALRLVEAADARGLVIRLMGGMAFRAHVPTWTARTERPEVDLDFATRSRDRAAVFRFLEEEGYTADRQHNALFGGHQGYFVDAARRRPVDVLVDRLEMCHRLEFGDRLTLARPTLPLADLLLTKLQVVRINRKDVLDALVLLSRFALGPDDGRIDDLDGATISTARIADVTGNDWGWWRTVTGTIATLGRFLDAELKTGDLDVGTPLAFDARAQLAALRAAIDDAPKSSRWRLRARVGERMKWYAEPEEVGHPGL